MILLVQGLLLSFLLWAQIANASFTVIANSSISSNSISKAELRSLFSAQRVNFGGSRVQVVMLRTKDPIAVAFFSSIGLSIPEFDRIWLEKALSGQASPPTKKATSREVILVVSTTVGAIGIIPAMDMRGLSEGAKVLTVN